MKVAIIGAGGIGGYYAARFHEAGNEVSIVARGKQLEALRENGLKVISPKGNFSGRIKTVTDDPYEIGEVDLVIVAVSLFLNVVVVLIWSAIAKTMKPKAQPATA